MKTLFRICLIGFVLILVLLVAAYFVVTDAGFQKRILEGRLPQGSSIRDIRITTNSLEFSELILAMPDGTRLKVDRVNTSFSPLAFLFDNTIQLGALNVDGLLVQLPETTAAAGDLISTDSGSVVSETNKKPMEPEANSDSSTASDNPWDLINQISDLQWLLEIESIQLDGRIKDASGSSYEFDISSGAIRPSTETVIDASLTLVSGEPTQAGLKELNSDLQLRLKQKEHGGFEQSSFESDTVAKDLNGRDVFSVRNTFELAFDGFEETASIAATFAADIQRPEFFVPEFQDVGALQVEGRLQADVDGMVVTLSDADLGLHTEGLELLSLDLKQALNLGGKQNLSGELLSLEIKQLPLSSANPWLAKGMSIIGVPLDAVIRVTGLEEGGMEIGSEVPIRVGPVSIEDVAKQYLQDATIVVDPLIRINADHSIEYELRALQFLDRYGEVLSGSISGTLMQSDRTTNPLAGQQAKIDLDIRLQELFMQPSLKDKVSVLGGRLGLDVVVDGDGEFPLIARGELRGLRPRSVPGSIKDFRFTGQLQVLPSEAWGLGLNFEAGSVGRPSTSLQLSGQAQPGSSPLAFKVDVTGKRLSQSDIDLLTAAFSPNESTTEPQSNTPTNPPPPSVDAPVELKVSVAPPWSEFKGDLTIKLDEFVLTSGQSIEAFSAKASISEPLLRLSDITARAGKGRLNGSAEVGYDAERSNAYDAQVNMGFQQFDPAFFSRKPFGSFPVQGRFDGQLQVQGSGETLEGVLERAIGDLKITGRNGVVTAFELDNRKQLGLGIVGILGQQFDRPGIAALTNTIPYFKDIGFESFVLQLTRGKDRKIRIPQLCFEGDSLLINGTGIIAATSFENFMEQPLSLALELGARGRLTHYLETLQLLQPTASEDGFRRWNQNVNIDGTLADPNMEQLMDILKTAANNAIVKPKRHPPRAADGGTGNQAPVGAELAQPKKAAKTQKEKSKEEKLLDDIEMGLDLLNTVFGGQK